ncbi:glycerophosphodiester phosphodiesterase [Streptomyces zagrosensis]|uniref:Glycerophosphoryl diester phosphodiesterase n=1 Tax=Streptomyces zagrosensis TaxID=1042984 RepID=A0A7W9UZR7_9ACTN|nr:glycerophosphodiester phosphodiesterase [Streptomyces zagrosensis]MBB5936029.1 glycerophosphoryl diester phosphodiesterase [Streptomyces zagrosensis]
MFTRTTPRVSRFTAVAHRGNPYEQRENTLASIRSALRAGADAVEIDVRVTRDNVPVLLHDATLKRLWGHDRPLADLTADEVWAVTGGGVPTLRDTLIEMTKDTHTARTMIDLPAVSAVPAVLATVRDADAMERVYYCGNLAALRAVRRADVDAEIAFTWTTLAPPHPELVAELRPRWLNYRFGIVSSALVERAHADGMLVSAWTADTKRTMRRLLRAGVDGITTNRISALCTLIQRETPENQ